MRIVIERHECGRWTGRMYDESMPFVNSSSLADVLAETILRFDFVKKVPPFRARIAPRVVRRAD